MSEILLQQFANPASQHDDGRVARQQLETWRDQIASQLGLTQQDDFLFTSGGTESNNLAILGHFPPNQNYQGLNVVSSAIEHPSVISALEWLKSLKVEIRWVDAGPDGDVPADEFAKAIDSSTRLVCCMLANNETGVIQPVEEIASICQERQVPFHVDAVQAIGKLKFDFSRIGCSTATISAHKFHGPTGIGGLLVHSNLRLSPMLHGGFQQSGIRPGTESLPLAAGLAKALEIALAEEEQNKEFLAQVRDHFEKLVLQTLAGAVVNGAAARRLPHTSNISFRGLDRQQLIMATDLAGLACSTGSACSSGSSQPSHVLTSMSCEKALIDSAVRFGFSSQNTLTEVERAVEIISRIFLAQTK